MSPLSKQDWASLGPVLPGGLPHPGEGREGGMSHKSFQVLIYVAFMRNLLYKEFYSIKLEVRLDS